MITVCVGGGLEYVGATAERDKAIVRECARYLFKKVGNHVTIVTDGRSGGVSEDFIASWQAAGALPFTVYGIIPLSESYAFSAKYPGRSYIVEQSVARAHKLRCALFVQPDDTAIMQMRQIAQNTIPTIVLGQGDRDALVTTDPKVPPRYCAAALVSEILAVINQFLPIELK